MAERNIEHEQALWRWFKPKGRKFEGTNQSAVNHVDYLASVHAVAGEAVWVPAQNPICFPINVAGAWLVLVEESDLDLQEFELAASILEKQERVENERGGRIANYCATIAMASVEDKTSDGILFCDRPYSEAIGAYAVHVANYKNLTDGTVFAVDYTSPLNYDKRRGWYKTFCIHARTKEELKEKIGA